MLNGPDAMTATLAKIHEEVAELKTLDTPPTEIERVELMHIIARYKIDASDPRENGPNLDE